MASNYALKSDLDETTRAQGRSPDCSAQWPRPVPRPSRPAKVVSQLHRLLQYSQDLGHDRIEPQCFLNHRLEIGKLSQCDGIASVSRQKLVPQLAKRFGMSMQMDHRPSHRKGRRLMPRKKKRQELVANMLPFDRCPSSYVAPINIARMSSPSSRFEDLRSISESMAALMERLA